MDITVTTHGQMEILHGLDESLKQISRGALKKEVIEATYQVMDRRFNRLMDADYQSGQSKIRHMYEWDAVPGNPAHRLWYTKLMDGDSVAFVFRQSTQQVPIDPRIDNVTSTDHVFREKARIFEFAEPVSISPKNVPFLRWYGGDEEDETRSGEHGSSLVKYKDKKTNVVHSLGTEIYASGGGAFANEFTNQFAIFWATAGVQGTADLSRVLNGSAHFRKAVDASQHRNQTITQLKQMRGTQRRLISDGRVGAASKKAAKEMLDAIKRELREYGYRSEK